MPEQQNNMAKDWKRNFNIAHSIAVIHQRGIVVVFRNQWGAQALGAPCAFAFVLMLLWFMCTQDEGILLWMGLWGMFYIKRRVEAVRLGKSGQIHSRYDGWPFDAIRFVKSERAAKRWVEPMLVSVLGGILFWIYTENGLRPTGLPYFILFGLATLPFVEAVKQTVWDNRIQAMQDAKIDQEMMGRDFQDKFGN